jgi:hypothetical protein
MEVDETAISFILGALGIQFGTRLESKKFSTVVESSEAGTPTPRWFFKPHPKTPLSGDHFVYAVIAAGHDSEGVRGRVELRTLIQNQWGFIRYGTPTEAEDALSFRITRGGR